MVKKFERIMNFEEIKKAIEDIIEKENVISVTGIFRELENRGYSMKNSFRKGYVYAVIDLLLSEGKAKERIFNRNMRLLINPNLRKNILGGDE